jgi:hypothetical protein
MYQNDLTYSIILWPPCVTRFIQYQFSQQELCSEVHIAVAYKIVHQLLQR